ncbi:uncharacterized protein LOC143550368 [Bidens hawaiensis]|uniref:uncharacterized protein LOC143550368 n=1 Tax=Bidens hawaiensis TaxID=980011 RepID=UPI00404AE02C
MFKGEALEWWNTLTGIKGRENLYNLDWATFKAMILKKFCPINEMDQIQTKLWNHKVVGTNLKEYDTKFLEYCRIVPQLVTPEINKVTRYIYGLPIEIRDLVCSDTPSTTESVMELSGRYFGRGLRPTNTITCNFYKRPGHVEANYKRKAVVCFDCGEKGHFSNECPKKKPFTVAAGAKTDAKK